jgi:hypothetical protein
MGPTDVQAHTAAAVALQRLQARYADVVTRRAWLELGELFRPDATVDLDTVTAEPRTLVGPHELGDFIAASIERFDHFSFVILNAVVEVDGTTDARGRMFMSEIRHDRTADEWTTAYGCYSDRYVKRDDRWWFAGRSYRSMARTGPDAAVFGVPPGLEPLGG